MRVEWTAAAAAGSGHSTFGGGPGCAVRSKRRLVQRHQPLRNVAKMTEASVVVSAVAVAADIDIGPNQSLRSHSRSGRAAYAPLLDVPRLVIGDGL